MTLAFGYAKISVTRDEGSIIFDSMLRILTFILYSVGNHLRDFEPKIGVTRFIC